MSLSQAFHIPPSFQKYFPPLPLPLSFIENRAEEENIEIPIFYPIFVATHVLLAASPSCQGSEIRFGTKDCDKERTNC